MSRYRATKAMIESLKGLDTSIAAQRARVHAAMTFEPKLLYTAGTNLKGIHGKGGALFARESFGLPLGKFEGIHGRTIAVPTRTGPPITTLPAEEIRQWLLKYRNTMQSNPDKIALLPPIGMGNAGIKSDVMLGMMDDAGLMQMGKQIVPTAEMVGKGFPETAARLRLIEGMKKAQGGTMPKVTTSFVGPMSFPIMGAKTIKSRTTFNAITAGERTMTTRKLGQGWEDLKVGDVFPITGKEGQTQLIKITHEPVIHTVTGKESQAFLNRWSQLEGHGPEQFNRIFKPGQKITMVKYKFGGKSVIHSGGADGADTVFQNAALKKGHEVQAHSFAGHARGNSARVEHSLAELKEADVYLHKANQTLKRRFPASNEYVNNLLRRNLYQVKDSDQVIAAAPIKYGQVQGGTAWATQMGIDMGKPVFVFDLKTNQWMKWVGNAYVPSSAPSLSASFAGIGSRKITKVGEKAIEDLFT